MKNINKLSEQEILALTTEELNTMVKLQMAEKGIKILSEPIEPEYEEIPKPTELLHSVSGFSYHFKDVALANKLGEVIRLIIDDVATMDYNYSIGSEYKFSKPLESYSKDSLGAVGNVMCYTNQAYNDIQDVIKRNKALKEEYQGLLSEYQEANNQSQDVKDFIYGRYHDVQRKFYDMNVIKTRYEEYLSLADGDATMAMKFLKKAYSVDKETEAYILGTDIVECAKPEPVINEKEQESEDLPIF